MFPTNQNFVSANGGLSNGNSQIFPMFLTAAPTSTTVYAPYGVAKPGQIAVVPGTGAYILINMTNPQGVLTATWTQISDADGPVLSVTGTANQILASPISGNVVLSLIGPYTPATYTLNGVLYGNGTSSIGATAAGTTGQVLTANTGAAPTWTTATFPSTAGATGTILRSNGTNWVSSTDTWPDTVVAGDLLAATATNVVGSIADVAVGQVLMSGGVGVIPAYSASPSVTGTVTAGTGLTATTGNILASGGDIITTRSAAGADVTIEATNSDNTSGTSRAGVEIATGGSSSGDPYLSFQISGVAASTMTMGLDNSASDLFVISNSTDIGTSNALTLSQAGALTATTTLTATLGDITATNGNIVRGTAGNKDVYSSVASNGTAGANSAGTATLAGGTITINTTAVTASSIIRLYRQGIGATGAAALGILTTANVVAATSFDIRSVQAADATALQASDISVVAWEIVN